MNTISTEYTCYRCTCTCVLLLATSARGTYGLVHVVNHRIVAISSSLIMHGHFLNPLLVTGTWLCVPQIPHLYLSTLYK